jgi:hypothetical protein
MMKFLLNPMFLVIAIGVDRPARRRIPPRGALQGTGRLPTDD